jgi:hypothetical protein
VFAICHYLQEDAAKSLLLPHLVQFHSMVALQVTSMEKMSDDSEMKIE